jgi:hypothetical protein
LSFGQLDNPREKIAFGAGIINWSGMIGRGSSSDKALIALKESFQLYKDEFTARNNSSGVRQESNPQSATTYISARYPQFKL